MDKIEEEKTEMKNEQKTSKTSVWFWNPFVYDNCVCQKSNLLKEILCLGSLQNSIELLKFWIIRILAKTCRTFHYSEILPSFLCTLATFEAE